MSDPFLQESPEIDGDAHPTPPPSQRLQVVSDESKPKEWESRGTVLGVVISVLATSGSHIAYLGAMFALMKTADHRLLSCERGEGIGWGRSGRFFCDYTKAYLQCFPELALTICLLIIGRNLLQTRMYYGLLQRGSVLQYKSKNMFSDGLMRFFLWCYAHSIMHLFVLMYIIWKGGSQDEFFNELKDTKGGRQKHQDQFFLGLSHGSLQPIDVRHPIHDEELKNDISVLVELVGFFVIPATLFLIYLFTGYDIEGSLVPLSQYFYDARQACREWAPGVSCELTVLDDDAVKLLVEHHQDHIHDVAESVTEAYDEVIKLYVAEGQMWEAKAKATGQTFIGISKAHWPARLLISEDATDLSSGSFRAVWVVFIVISLTLQFFMMVSLYFLVTDDLAEAREQHRTPLWHLAVVLVNICVEVFGITVNAHSFTQWIRHDYLRSRDHEKDWKSKKGKQQSVPDSVGDKLSD